MKNLIIKSQSAHLLQLVSNFLSSFLSGAFPSPPFHFYLNIKLADNGKGVAIIAFTCVA